MSSNSEMQNENVNDAGMTVKSERATLKRPSLGPDGMRIRVNVPADDEAVVEWLNLQHDRSMSIRMIIRDAIRRYGMKDFFATSTDSIRKSATPGPKPGVTAAKPQEHDALNQQAQPAQDVKARPRVEVTSDDALLQSLMDM